MESFFLQSPFRQKTISLALLFVIAVNMVFMFVLIPTKEARAQLPVIDTALIAALTKKTVVETTWESFKAAYRAADTVLQKVTSIFSGISSAIDVWTKADNIATKLIKAALLLALQQILQMMTNEIIKWINGGGSPKFVSDWQGFLRDAADRAGGEFLDTLTGGILCKPFAFQIRLALMPVGYSQYARCTLKDIGANLQNFFNNFSTGGGWGMWLQVIQPQNNFYGSYLMALDEKTRRELAAAEAAKNEAIAGGGFMSAKKCVSCVIESFETGQSQQYNNSETCEGYKKSPDPGFSFRCTNEQIMTPASVVQYEAQQVIDSARQQLQNTISTLTANTDIFQPYLIAIANALINRVVQLGLSTVGQAIAGGDSSYGPTFSNPEFYMPASEPLIGPIYSSGIPQTEETLSASPILIVPQTLLKENLETQLLDQRQRNLSILNSTKNAQLQTLQTLSNMLAQNCSLPAWVSSQVISDNGAEQIIKLSANALGTITIKKTTSSSQIGSSVTTEIQESAPSVQPQIDALQLKIVETQQQISDTNSAIAANRQAMADAQAYQDLYQTAYSSSLNAATQQKLDAAQQKAESSYDSALSYSQKAAKSQETSLALLIADTGTQAQSAISEANTANSARDTLNSNLSSAQSKSSETQTLYQSCLQEQQLQLQQQQQSQSSPFMF